MKSSYQLFSPYLCMFGVVIQVSNCLEAEGYQEPLGTEGTRVHLQEFHGRLCWCCLPRHRPALVTDLPKHHTSADFSGHTECVRQDWL